MKQHIRYIVHSILIFIVTTALFMPLIPGLLCAYAAHMIPRQTWKRSRSGYLTIASLLLTVGVIVLLGCMINFSSGSRVVVRLSPDALRTALACGLIIFASGLACLATRQFSVRATLWTGALTLLPGGALIYMDIRAQEIGPGIFVGIGLATYGIVSLFISPFRYSYLNEPERVYAPPMVRRPVRPRAERGTRTRGTNVPPTLPPETALMSSAKLRSDALSQRSGHVAISHAVLLKSAIETRDYAGMSAALESESAASLRGDNRRPADLPPVRRQAPDSIAVGSSLQTGRQCQRRERAPGIRLRH